MARLLVMSFGGLMLALAAVAGLEAFTSLHPPEGRPGGSVDRQEPGAHASMPADCGRGLLAGK